MEQLTWIRSEGRLVTLRYAGSHGARSPRLTGPCVSASLPPPSTRNNNNCIRPPPTISSLLHAAPSLSAPSTSYSSSKHHRLN